MMAIVNATNIPFMQFFRIENIANNHMSIPSNQTMRRIPVRQSSVPASDKSMTV
jgi:hypothetical protein